MNPQTLKEARSLATSIKRSTRSFKKSHIILCPPFVYLPSLLPAKNQVFLGAQDAFYEPHGSFTGEVSSAQLSALGVDFCLVGHSERRALGETDVIINKKVRAIVDGGMTAILCVGEKVHDPHGEYLSLVKQQIVSGLKDISKHSVHLIVIAYEPIWAVGGKVAMRPAGIAEMAIFIKKVLRDMYGTSSDEARVLYGGDVTAGNAMEIVRDGFVHGLLVGRESLKPKSFIEIIRQVDKI